MSQRAECAMLTAANCTSQAPFFVVNGWVYRGSSAFAPCSRPALALPGDHALGNGDGPDKGVVATPAVQLARIIPFAPVDHD
jgi:hypothetical protein